MANPDSTSIPDAKNANPSGLGSEDYCYLKCWVALVRVGKQLLTQVFSWGFPNPENRSLRESLSQLLGYSNTKYKNDFNKDERGKIENGTVLDFDITLLFTIIQRLCRLTPASSQINAPGTIVKKLSELLLQVKNTRNKFAHPLLNLTATDMTNYINDMKQLFESVIEESQIEFDVPLEETSSFKIAIDLQLSQIINSPLPASTISEQLEQIAKEKVGIVIQETLKDCKQRYKHLCDVSVTPWPFVPLRKQVQDVFIKTKLKHISSYIFQNGLSKEESEIDVDKILCMTHIDLCEPEFVLLTGHSGIGKSISLKYIISSWMNSSTSTIENIDSFDLVFYINCRKTSSVSLDRFLAETTPSAAMLFPDDELKKIVMSLKCIFLLDNIDELQSDSLPLINELISSSPNIKIIASATQDPGNNIVSKSQNKRPLNIIMNGFPASCVQDYVKLLHKSIPENLRRDDFENFFTEIQSEESLMKDWFNNPEILSHIFFNWHFSSDKSDHCLTLTQVLLQSFNLIVKKLMDKLSLRSMAGVMEAEVLKIKLQTFLLELGRIAISSLKNGTTGLGFKDTSQLLVKCQELGLPANLLMSEFLCFRETVDEKMLQTSLRVTFPSISFQEFCSAYHMFSKLKTGAKLCLKEELEIRSLSDTKNCQSRLMNILRFLIGLLASNNSILLEEYSSEIIGILQSFCEVKKSSVWLQILQEARGHAHFTELILVLLKGSWEISDNGISLLMVNLIKNRSPDVLSMTAVKDPNSLPHWNAALEEIKYSRNPIKLSLYIYSHFWNSENQLSDEYIHYLFSDGTNCQLENFAGQISPQYFPFIPKATKRLALRMNLNDINKFNKILPNLSELQLLSLNLSFDENSQPTTCALALNNSLNTMLSIEMFRVNEKNLNVYCKVLSSLSTRYTRIGLRRTSLNLDSAKDFIRKLGSLSIGSLVIGSTEKLKTHEKVNLNSISRDYVGCKEVKWIDL